MTTTTTACARACFPARSARSDRTTRLPDPGVMRPGRSPHTPGGCRHLVKQLEKVFAGSFLKRGMS